MISSDYSSYTFQTFPHSYSTLYDHKSFLTKHINQKAFFSELCLNFLIFTCLNIFTNDKNDYPNIYIPSICPNQTCKLTEAWENLNTCTADKHTLPIKTTLTHKSNQCVTRTTRLIKTYYRLIAANASMICTNPCKFERLKKKSFFSTHCVWCDWLICLRFYFPKM